MNVRRSGVGKRSILAAGLLIAVFSSRPQAAPQQPETARSSATAARATLDRYCVSCHSDRLKTGGLSLQGVDPSRPATHADMLERRHWTVRARSTARSCEKRRSS